MKPVSILIVEDKAIISEALAMTLEKAGYSISARADSGENALLLVNDNPPDIILMDIQLAGKLDGIQTAKLLSKTHSIPIIYLTDFHDKATIERAKHTHPAAYLLKPFNPNDLLIAIEIAFHNASKKAEAVVGENEKPAEDFFPFEDRFFIKEKDTLHRVNIDDVLWIEAAGSYCAIKTSQKNFTLSISLRVFNERFNHPMLLRVHRSYMVNIDKITAIKGNMLVIGQAPSHEIPTSESYRDAVFQRLRMI